eukprot:4278686-Pleurochrysis_carterae.AAC.1
MLVVVPRCDGEGNAVMLRPTAEKDSIGERSKRGDLEGLVVMKNREPKWNPVSNMYQLDFHGRATMASCKNIQLHPKARARARCLKSMAFWSSFATVFRTITSLVQHVLLAVVPPFRSMSLPCCLPTYLR